MQTKNSRRCPKSVFKNMFDLFFFLAFSWPLTMPYYIAKTRSARAWYYIAVGLGIYFLSYLFGVMYARLADMLR